MPFAKYATRNIALQIATSGIWILPNKHCGVLTGGVKSVQSRSAETIRATSAIASLIEESEKNMLRSTRDIAIHRWETGKKIIAGDPHDHHTAGNPGTRRMALEVTLAALHPLPGFTVMRSAAAAQSLRSPVTARTKALHRCLRITQIHIKF